MLLKVPPTAKWLANPGFPLRGSFRISIYTQAGIIIVTSLLHILRPEKSQHHFAQYGRTMLRAFLAMILTGVILNINAALVSESTSSGTIIINFKWIRRTSNHIALMVQNLIDHFVVICPAVAHICSMYVPMVATTIVIGSLSFLTLFVNTLVPIMLRWTLWEVFSLAVALVRIKDFVDLIATDYDLKILIDSKMPYVHLVPLSVCIKAFLYL